METESIPIKSNAMRNTAIGLLFIILIVAVLYFAYRKYGASQQIVGQGEKKSSHRVESHTDMHDNGDSGGYEHHHSNFEHDDMIPV